MNVISDNVNDAFVDVLYMLRHAPVRDSRNGKVKCMMGPSILSIRHPLQRVLFNPLRKANPYFHVMETVWMLAGSNDGMWLSQFNKQIQEYCEDDGTINGAYGHRWLEHFGENQINWVIEELNDNWDSRQAVIAMYDPVLDHNPNLRDRPCNTHIYFRVVNGALDMTVCNRSNDAIWGMLGANVVHMTYLQELVARCLGLSVGYYHVMTNNLHIYEHHWPLLDNPLPYDHYIQRPDAPYPILHEGESLRLLLEECRRFVLAPIPSEMAYTCKWMNNVVVPMHDHYICRLNGDYDTYDMEENKAEDWRYAEQLWRKWHNDD